MPQANAQLRSPQARSQRASHVVHACRSVQSALSVGAALFALACGGSGGQAQYPELKVSAKVLELTLIDSRNKWTDPITEMETLDRTESNTYAQKLPANAEAELRSRLQRVTGGKGPELRVSCEVRRGDITFFNTIDGDFVRYDVGLGFRVTTSTGALLQKGQGRAYRQLPSDQVNAQSLARTFEEATVAAMDQYWASEDTLEKINEQLERYLQTHPNER
jgi:hypothetical protein